MVCIVRLHVILGLLRVAVLLDIEFHELNWRIINSLPSTQSGLYRVSGRAGEMLSKVWRFIERATATVATAAFTVPERIIWMKASS